MLLFVEKMNDNCGKSVMFSCSSDNSEIAGSGWNVVYFFPLMTFKGNNQECSVHFSHTLAFAIVMGIFFIIPLL